MNLHIILGPARCIACDAKVVWGWVDGLGGKTAHQRRWRDPVTYRVHVCTKEGEAE